MLVHAQQRLKLETDLRYALERRELSLVYQPIICTRTQSILGFESLIRWQHPQHGRVGPGEFIPLAEETRLIVPIGLWVLQQSCQQLQEWRSTFPQSKHLYVSVNLSSLQLIQPDLIASIDACLADTGLPATCLRLELTETVLIENKQQAQYLLSELQRRSIKIAIDDFGTGFSSLSYLHQFPVNVLKIDRSFVTKIDEETHGIVGAIMALGKHLNLSIIAEGVETKGQLATLRRLQCHQFQGYYFSRPLAIESIPRLLSRIRA